MKEILKTGELQNLDLEGESEHLATQETHGLKGH